MGNYINCLLRLILIVHIFTGERLPPDVGRDVPLHRGLVHGHDPDDDDDEGDLQPLDQRDPPGLLPPPGLQHEALHHLVHGHLLLLRALLRPQHVEGGQRLCPRLCHHALPRPLNCRDLLVYAGEQIISRKSNSQMSVLHQNPSKAKILHH